MYYEVWVDKFRKKEVEEKLSKVCLEIHEVFYDYQYVVDVPDESFLKIEGVKRYKKHYDC